MTHSSYDRMVELELERKIDQLEQKVELIDYAVDKLIDLLPSDSWEEMQDFMKEVR